MNESHCHHSSKRLRVTAFLLCVFLCVSMMAEFFPIRAAAEGEKEKKFSEIVKFNSITLHYPGVDGQLEGEKVQGNALLTAGQKLVLRYTYEISKEQCENIVANTPYYLNVSPHLVLPDLQSGSPLTIETDAGKVEFGKIYADSSSGKAWVSFNAKEADSGTVLSEYDGISDAYFYLNCGRAGKPPAGETPIDGNSNLYAMKFENNEQLVFGYAEDEPVTAKAQIQKDGSLKDKTITWTIDYTPWQNPSASDPVTLDTPFELRDTIDTALHSYVDGSVTIDGVSVTPTSRDQIQGSPETYVIVETPADGTATTLTFGGTKFKAGQATQGNPAKPLKITYETTVNDSLLLPGGSGDKKVTNAAQLFAGKDGGFSGLDMKSQSTVTVPQPVWLTKTGKTTRHTGNGSTTDWTVTFNTNGFSFTTDGTSANGSSLTLHDKLPAGSTLVDGSVKVDSQLVSATTDSQNGFTVSPITANGQPVTITYQTHVPEDMYDNGTNLGNNIAWFTFQMNGQTYTTPEVITPVGSGDGTGTPGTSTLVKTNDGYHSATRTIDWTVTINPHKAYLKSGTFTDDLKSAGGGSCKGSGHGSGLELKGGVDDIRVLINDHAPTEDEKTLVILGYDQDQQILNIKVGEIGAKTIKLKYTTKVCDPCIFANNTVKTPFTNRISTDDMLIGQSATAGRGASADSTADVSAAVLTKKAPVYDYASGIMKWTAEVDAAGLSMENIVLTDTLPAGLTYVENSLVTSPAITDARANAVGQELTINLGPVTQLTTITFDTQVDPELLGFGGDRPVVVENTIRMNGKADGMDFAEVSHKVRQSFSNHGLVKSSHVDNPQELIQYEVLINPFHLLLPENPAIVDTLDERLQLDTDTLMFYPAKLTGTTADSNDQKPGYTKEGDGQKLEVTGYDPEQNSFTVQLPIPHDGSRKAYVLTYTADIIRRETGGYGNSVRFDGGLVLLGGSKNNSASVGGGGGGGGGGVAARKAGITVAKKDSENQKPLAGVTFTLYQWDSVKNVRGLPFARGVTDAQGKLSFKVKPGAVYELEETQSIPGYDSSFQWGQLPANVEETDRGLLITAGAAKSELELELTNRPFTADIVFRLFNRSGIPMTGETVSLFLSDPTGMAAPVPDMEVIVLADGTVRFSGLRRGAAYYIRQPGGEIMTVELPAEAGEEAKVKLPDGTEAALTADYRAEGAMAADRQWALAVTKVNDRSKAPLAGAVVGLYADEACSIFITSGTSGTDGRIVFEGLIKGQRYWLKEMAAPADYSLNTAVFQADEASPLTVLPGTPKPPAVKPGRPGGSETSGNSGTSNSPGTSGNSGTSNSPGMSGNSGTSNSPGTSGNAGTSNSTGTIGNAGASDQSGASKNLSETFESPGVSDASVRPGGVSVASSRDTPRTGDDISRLIGTVSISGMLFVIMALYQIWEVKKRK